MKQTIKSRNLPISKRAHWLLSTKKVITNTAERPSHSTLNIGMLSLPWALSSCPGANLVPTSIQFFMICYLFNLSIEFVFVLWSRKLKLKFVLKSFTVKNTLSIKWKNWFLAHSKVTRHTQTHTHTSQGKLEYSFNTKT